MPMKDAEEIRRIFDTRTKTQSQAHSRMREVSKVYNDQIYLPLPELNKAEKPAVPNLAQQGLDQTAMRIASVLPDVVCPSTRPGIEIQDRRATKRREAIMGWWQFSRMNMIMRKRARHFIGYAAAPVVIKPDLEHRAPRWHAYDPTHAYPSNWGDPTQIVPEDCIFAAKRTGIWLQSHYPEEYSKLQKGEGFNLEDQYTVLEYYSAEQYTMIVVGKEEVDRWSANSPSDGGAAKQILLGSAPNRTGKCPVAFPCRVNLDGSRGQFDGILGMYQTQAMLMAMQVLATYKGVFAETWIQDLANDRAEVEQIPNPVAGIPGIIHGGSIQKFPVDPQFQTNEAMDRLEYAQRSTASIPAEYGGYGGTNVRTGRRGAQVMGAAVDFPIQEAQETLAMSLECENKIAVGIDKAYFGNESKSFYLSWEKHNGHVTYRPDEIFDTDANRVSYAYAGVDSNALIIELGQRLGLETISRESFMEHDPLIKDVEAERDKVRVDQIEGALMARLQAEAANPESPITPMDLAKLMQLVKSDRMELPEAFETINQDIKEREAAQMKAMQEAMQAQQGAEPDPAAMPGMEGAPPGMEGGMPMVGAPPSGAENLGSLLGTLRQPSMQVTTPGGTRV
jgi:hypothetical protein